MTLPARIDFDPALPVVAAQVVAVSADRKLSPGERFDWRELGIDENVLHMWWLSGLVYFEPMPEEPAPPAAATEERGSKPKRKAR